MNRTVTKISVLVLFLVAASHAQVPDTLDMLRTLQLKSPINNPNVPGILRIFEALPSPGNQYIEIRAPFDLATNVPLIWPVTVPGAGNVLTAITVDSLGWTTPSGVGTITGVIAGGGLSGGGLSGTVTLNANLKLAGTGLLAITGDSLHIKASGVSSAEIASNAVSQPKLVLATGAGDANTLTLHDLISGTPGIDDVPKWNGTNWVPGTGGSSLTVREVDLSPSVANVGVIEFLQTSGLVVTDQTGGTARVANDSTSWLATDFSVSLRQAKSDTATYDATKTYVNAQGFLKAADIATKQDDSDTTTWDATRAWVIGRNYLVAADIATKQDDADTTTWDATRSYVLTRGYLTTVTSANIIDGTITGDDINSNLAGSGLVLTAGSPDMLDFAPSELQNVTFANGAVASGSITFNLSGAVDPAITFTDGIVNVSTGALQESGNAVPNSTDNLGFFSSTTSVQLATVLSNESGATGVFPLFNLTTVAQGHVLYFNGTNWVNLSPGSSGQVLHTQGIGANPIWDTDDGAGGGAPIDATYITQTSNLTLTAEQAIGTLATGIMASTTTTGIVATRILTGTAGAVTVTNGDGSSNPTFTLPSTVTVPTAYSIGADPADAGALRLENAASIAWESSPAATDLTLTMDVNEVLQSSANFNAPILTEGTNAVPNSTDNLSFFASTTSAQLAGVLSNETGTSLAVFNTNPTLAGFTVSGGDANFNDGATDSPTLNFTPQTGTAWTLLSTDTDDDLEIRSASSAVTENVDVLNPGAGVVNLTVEGAIGASNFSGSSSGANTGDQTITLTGNVTGSGTGSFATTIATGIVTNAMLSNMAQNTIKMRVAAGAGAPEDIDISAGLALVTAAAGDFIIIEDATDGGLKRVDASNFLGGAVTWDAIGDPGTGADIAFANTAQTLTWDTPATATAVDAFKIRWSHDATTDGLTQNLLVLERSVAAAGSQVLEAMLKIDNADNQTVTNGIQILGSSTGVITTAVDASDAEIATALAIGSNDITTAATTIASTELDRLDGKDAALIDLNDSPVVTGAWDFGGATSVEVPNGTTPVVNLIGEIAVDSDAWAASRGTLVIYDGTVETRTVNVLSTDTPLNGQVPKWNTDGTITWEDDATGAGGGDAISVNSTAATDADFDDATPSAPANSINVNWLITGASPSNISANVLLTEINQTGTITSQHDVQVAGTALTAQNTTDAVSDEVLRLHSGNRVTPANNDEGYISLRNDDNLSNQIEFSRLSWLATDVLNTSKDAAMTFDLMVGNVLTEILRLQSTAAGVVTVNVMNGTLQEAGSSVYTAADGNLTDDDLSNNSINDLNDVTITTAAAANILVRNAGNTAFENVALSSDVTIAASGAATIPSGAVLLSELGNPSAGTKTFTMGTSNIIFNFTDAGGGIEYNLSGTASGHLLEYLQVGTSASASTHLVHVGAQDPDVTTLHVHHEAPSVAGGTDVIAIMIDTEDDNDPDFVPLLVQDDSDLTPDTIFKLDYRGAIVTPLILTSTLQLANYTTNGFVKTSGGNGTLAIDANTYLTGNQNITLSGDVSGSGATAISTTISNDVVTFAKFQNITDVRLLGRSAGTDGDMQEIIVGSGLLLSAGTLSSTVSAAPVGATYITQIADGTLSAEQALGALASGMLASTITTGVVASRVLTGTTGAITITNGDGSANPTFTLPTAITVPTSYSIGADPADAGVVMLENAAIIGWESSPAAADITLTVDASEIMQSSVTLNAPTFTEGTNAVPNATDNLSFFAATTSAQLFGVLNNETGSASGTPLAVFNQNPTLGGATINGGNVAFSDGSGDSPIAIFTPATGTVWNVFSTDADDDLQIQSANTAVAENIGMSNPGTGTVTLTVEGTIGASNFSGASSGTNTGDQTITLTSDVTGSGTTSFATTIANDAVTNAKAANMAQNTIKMRVAAGASDPEDIDISTGLSLVTAATGDFIIIEDATDGGLKRVDASDFLGGAASWSSLTAPTGATSFVSDVATETFTLDFQSDFSVNQFIVRQTVGNPTAGALAVFQVNDTQASPILKIENTGDQAPAIGIQVIVSGTIGSISTGLDVSDVDILDAINIGSNNLKTNVTTISSLEFDRLDGKDAALIDVNDSPSLTGAWDFGGAISIEVPNSAAPTTDVFGEIAGDNDAWAASRGAVQFYDGTANTLLVGAIASDIPAAGEVPKFQTGGTITWEADVSGGTPTWNSISAPTGATSFVSDAGTETITFDFQSAFAADQFIIKQTTGNPTAGSLAIIQVADANVSPMARIENAAAVTIATGLQILATTTGVITTALDLSDAEIVTALSLGTNDITTGAATLASTELDRLDGKDAALIDLNDSPALTGAWDFGGTTSLELPNAADPSTTVEGQIAWDSNNDALEVYNGTDSRIVAIRIKSIHATIVDPDVVQPIVDAVTILSVETEMFPFGITLVSVGIKTDASSTYAVNFEEWTSPTDGAPSTIEAVTTSATTEAEDDGTLTDASIAAGSIIKIDLPITNIAELTIWITYTINEGN